MYKEKFKNIKMGITYDDVLILPRESEVEPNEAKVDTRFTKKIPLNIPIIAAAMDTVSEHEMAITMAREGGLAVIHRNMPVEDQVKEIFAVKDAGFIIKNVFSIAPDSSVQEAHDIMQEQQISGLPVVKNEEVVGIITYNDVRFLENKKAKVSEKMTKEIITVSPDVNMKEALKLMKKNKIERLPVIHHNKLFGIITEMDIRLEQKYTNAIRNNDGTLITVAAVGPFDIARAKELDKAEVDVLCIDTAHAHNMNVVRAVKKLKKEVSAELCVGNIATKEAAETLVSAGADAIKVGIGPGSICTTRVIAGVGVPQLTAISEVADAVSSHKIPVIADGGIRYSGDIAKALAAGADVVMIGNLLAGTDEAPGRLTIVEGRKYKQYRGMGSIGAMNKGGGGRYFQEKTTKFVPEGIEGLVPYKGKAGDVLFQLIGGLRSSMGYVGAKNLQEFKKRAKFTSITHAATIESHPHDVLITDEAPNYYKLK